MYRSPNTIIKANSKTSLEMADNIKGYGYQSRFRHGCQQRLKTDFNMAIGYIHMDLDEKRSAIASFTRDTWLEKKSIGWVSTLLKGSWSSVTSTALGEAKKAVSVG